VCFHRLSRLRERPSRISDRVRGGATLSLTPALSREREQGSPPEARHDEITEPPPCRVGGFCCVGRYAVCKKIRARHPRARRNVAPGGAHLPGDLRRIADAADERPPHHAPRRADCGAERGRASGGRARQATQNDDGAGTGGARRNPQAEAAQHRRARAEGALARRDHPNRQAARRPLPRHRSHSARARSKP
jgi:hypothetical protein